MEKKNVIFLSVIAVATLLTAVIGTTFAYFTANITTSNAAIIAATFLFIFPSPSLIYLI